MNYIGDIKLKKSLLDHLLKEFEIKTRFNEIYLSKKDIRYIIKKHLSSKLAHLKKP